MVQLHHATFENVAMILVWLNMGEDVWHSFVEKLRSCLDTMVISILEHLNSTQKQDDQKCKSFALKNKQTNKQKPTTTKLQLQQTTTAELIWVLVGHITSLADPSVACRAFTSPFFLTSCSLHFEVMFSWCDKQTEPIPCPTYLGSLLILDTFLTSAFFSTITPVITITTLPQPMASHLLGHSTDEDLIFIDSHYLGFVWKSRRWTHQYRQH